MAGGDREGNERGEAMEVEAEDKPSEQKQSESELAKLVKSVVDQCQKAASQGIAKKNNLPKELVEEFAGAMEAYSARALAQRQGQDDETSCQALISSVEADALANLCQDLEPAFNACKSCLPELSSKGKKAGGQRASADLTIDERKLTDIQVTMKLASACFHASAIGIALSKECDHPEAFWAFLSRVVHAAGQASLTSASSTAGTGGRQNVHALETQLPCLWQAAHKVVVAESYRSTLMTRRTVRIAAQCAGMGLCARGPPSDRSGAPREDHKGEDEQRDVFDVDAGRCSPVEELLISVLSFSEPSLQELALEVWAEALSSAVPARLRSIAQQAQLLSQGDCRGKSKSKAVRKGAALPAPEPGVCARVAMHAICGVCMARACKDLRESATIGNSSPSQQHLQAAARCCSEARVHAEQLAAAITEAILRQCLLAEERDADAWLSLEHLIRDAALCSLSLAWPSAPLLVLCLAKGLKRIAGASRGTEIPCHKREFAIRLLGQIAASLTEGRVEAESARTSSQAMSAWKDLAKKVAAPATAGPAEVLLVHMAKEHLLRGGRSGRSRSNTGNGSSKHGLVDVANLRNMRQPSLHLVCGIAFSLCSIASGCCSQSEASAGKCKGGQAKRSKKAPRVAVHEEKPPQGAAWALESWVACFSTSSLRHQKGQTEALQLDEGLKKEVVQLYIMGVFQGGPSEVARTLSLSLESLVSELEGSHFAFVRRQAAVGIGHVCEIHPAMVMTRRIAEAVGAGLQDDSALVRSTMVDIAGRLLANRKSPSNSSQLSRKAQQFARQALTDAAKAELHAAVRARLSDATPYVRKAAFRVECEALHPNSPGLLLTAAELLRQIRHEEEVVRAPVLHALEKALLPPPPAQATLSHLASLTIAPGVGGVGLQDVLCVHKARSEPQAFHEAMCKVASGAAARVAAWRKSPSAEDSPSQWALVLSQVAAVCPSSCYGLLKELQAWLQRVPEEAPLWQQHMFLAQQACRVLSDTLPGWAAEVAAAKTSVKARVGNALIASLEPLLQERRSNLTRSVVECLCIIATEVLGNTSRMVHMAADCVAALQEASTQGAPSSAQPSLCHQAWLLGGVLEFLADVAAAVEMAEVAAKPLSLLCMAGSAQWRACVLPCLGFLLRRHHNLLLQTAAPEEPSLGRLIFEALSSGLHAGLNGQIEEAMVLTARAVEVLASLLAAYEKRVQEKAQGSSGPKGLNEAIQRLAQLQGELLQALALPSATMHALEALQVLSRWGVLHPSAALPKLVGTCLAGPPATTRSSQRLLLSLVTSSSQLLTSRLGAGLHAAAALLDKADHGHAQQEGSFWDADAGILSEGWRFVAMCSACSECFEPLKLRLQLLEAIVAEVLAVAFWGGGRKALPAGLPSDAVALRRRIVLHAELGAAILASLPVRSDVEVARILSLTSNFLTLNIGPLLLSDAEAATSCALSQDFALFTCVTSAVMLHAACSHLCRNSEVPRLLRLADEGAASSGGDNERAVGLRSSSKGLPSLGSLRRELLATEGARQKVMAVLSQHIALSSPLIRSSSSCQAAPTAGLQTPTKVEGKGRRRKASSEPVACGTKAKRSCSGADSGKANGLVDEAALTDAAGNGGA